VLQMPPDHLLNLLPCLPTAELIHDPREFAWFHDRKITIWKGFALPSSGSRFGITVRSHW